MTSAKPLRDLWNQKWPAPSMAAAPAEARLIPVQSGGGPNSEPPRACSIVKVSGFRRAKRNKVREA